jgi:RNA polymerase sigma-70 factor (ECF subfamily)
MSGKFSTDVADEALVAEVLRDPHGVVGRAAASELFGRHRRRVYLWCYRYLRHHDRAVDLAQDVMVNAFRGLGSFEGRSKFSSWLFGIARNRCLKALAAPSLVRDEEVELEAIADPGTSVELLVEGADNEERLRALLMRHLDVQEREALWLRCFERMPVDAISEAMHLENATGARALLQRARRKLRGALADQAHMERA